jgi:hypothetical protein
MVIRRKSSIDKKNYELSGQLTLFGRDNLDFKTVNLAKGQKLVNLCKVFKLKKITLQKKMLLSFFEIY